MTIKSLIEILFPPSTDELCFRHSKDQLLESAHLHHESQLNVGYLYSYQIPEVQAMIRLTKFHHHRETQLVLAEAVRSCLSHYFPTHIFIPIPLSAKRERERGYNQVTEVLRHLSKTNIQLETSLLKRHRHTTAQTSLRKQERLQNLKDAFIVTKPKKITGQHIILIDDVLTTGATLKAARQEIEKYSPASLTCLTFAH